MCVLGEREGLILTGGEDGGREGVVGDHGVRRDDKRGDSVVLSMPSPGPTGGGLLVKASWGHPGTRSARRIKSASPCMEPFVQQNPA